MVQNLRKYGLWLLGLMVATWATLNMVEVNGAGEILVIQGLDGNLKVVYKAGPTGQFFGDVTRYRKSSQIYFLAPEDKKLVGTEEDKSLPVKFNDGGHAWISGSIRVDLPLDEAKMKKVHSTYGSQESVQSQLVNTNVSKSIFMTGPLMSSKESYAEKRNDLIYYIEDQSSKGVYKTKTVITKEPDPLSGVEKNVSRVEIVLVNGSPFRQEKSSIEEYGIRLHNISINDIRYDDTVEGQIQNQQKSIMQVQTAIANAKRAEQEAITTAKQGEANAATAKWEQEVIKAKMVTQAEARNAQAELDVRTAALNKQKAILEGEGEAAKKRLVMQADGALTQKLLTYERVMANWAKSIGEYQGNWVPLYTSGGGNNGSTPFNIMETLGAKAARDLAIDLSNKK
jgi:regulator of protease activity HflC (stomatin/prohibitin superfamily)